MSNLVSALQLSLKPRKEGYTVLELCTLAKLPETIASRIKIRAFLKSEISAGRITGQQGFRMAIDGIPRSAPVYLPIAAKKTRG